MNALRRRILCSLLSVLFLSGAGVLSILWWEPVEQGVATLSWPSAPAEILAAEFWNEYDPEASSSSDFEVRKTSARIAVAYTVETAVGTRHYETFHFDTFGPRGIDDGLMAGEACEVRAVMRAGPNLRVHYSPHDPSQAVIQPGIPHYTSGLFLFPCTLLGLALGMLRWATRSGDSPPRSTEDNNKPVDHMAGLLGWGTLFPCVAMIPIFFLRPVSVWLFGCLVPWWILPSFYVLALLFCVTPNELLCWKPVNVVLCWVVSAMMLAIPALLVAGIVAHVVEPTKPGFGFELTDADCVARLDAKNPIVARWAAWEIVTRDGPREAVPGLRRLLDSPDIKTREAAVIALGRVGVAAMVALDDLESRVEKPQNAEIRHDFESLVQRLRNYRAMQEKVTLKRELLSDSDETTRLAAAFWLGHLGELAAPALPDLEAALVDPSNDKIKLNIEAAIHRIRHAVYAHAESRDGQHDA